MNTQEEEYQPTEPQEAKDARRRLVEELTARFLAEGKAITQVATGVSAKRLTAIKPRCRGNAPILVVNGEDKKYKQGQNPESANSWLFEDKKKPH